MAGTSFRSWNRASQSNQSSQTWRRFPNLLWRRFPNRRGAGHRPARGLGNPRHNRFGSLRHAFVPLAPGKTEALLSRGDYGCEAGLPASSWRRLESLGVASVLSPGTTRRSPLCGMTVMLSKPPSQPPAFCNVIVPSSPRKIGRAHV